MALHDKVEKVEKKFDQVKDKAQETGSEMLKHGRKAMDDAKKNGREIKDDMKRHMDNAKSDLRD